MISLIFTMQHCVYVSSIVRWTHCVDKTRCSVQSADDVTSTDRVSFHASSV